MSWYTDWFLADEAEAEAVARIASDDEHTFDDWPHLAMKSIGEIELKLLRAILSGRSGMENFHGGTLYHDGGEEGGVVVTRVLPTFVEELSSLTDEQAERIAAAWQQAEDMADWEPSTAAEVLRVMAAFARRAVQEDKPILQLSTWTGKGDILNSGRSLGDAGKLNGAR